VVSNYLSTEGQSSGCEVSGAAANQNWDGRAEGHEKLACASCYSLSGDNKKLHAERASKCN